MKTFILCVLFAGGIISCKVEDTALPPLSVDELHISELFLEANMDDEEICIQITYNGQGYTHDGPCIAFFPDSVNIKLFMSNDVLRTEYDGPADEAAKILLDAVRMVGENKTMGYVLLTREEYNNLKEK